MCASNLTLDAPRQQPVIYQGDDFDHTMTPEEWAMIESVFDGRRLLILARFWSRADRSGGPDACWPWIGDTTGAFEGRGVHSWRGKQTFAARIAYEMAYGPIPPGLFALHKCPGKHNPRCVNPRHLYAGTRAENALDAIANGTRPTGEQSPQAKLTNEQVRAIRARYVKYQRGPDSSPALSKEFSVSEATIIAIVRRRMWKHLD